MGWFRGIGFVFLWYSSIIWSVYFVYAPLTILLLINRKWFRKVTDIVLSCWEMYPAALLEILMGCRVCLSGVDINPDESSLLIMNHRNRLDWFFLWAALLHSSKPPAHRCKFVLKSDVRWIPGIGWGLQLAGFLFIYRDWVRDQLLLKRSLDYFRDLGEKYQILIFPEGTDFSPATKIKSDSFAKKSGLPCYNYVLHPRTTGFAFLVSHMKQNSQLDSVYDITIGYPKTLPSNETDILKGKIPEEVHFHIERHPAKDVPSTEESVKQWCEERWAMKEKALEKFYSVETDRKFNSVFRCDRPWNAMYFALVGWTGWTAYTVYLTFTTSFWFYWVILCTVTFILVSGFTTGMQQLEIDLYRKYDNPEIPVEPQRKATQGIYYSNDDSLKLKPNDQIKANGSANMKSAESPKNK